jgi:hypothetical protein
VSGLSGLVGSSGLNGRPVRRSLSGDASGLSGLEKLATRTRNAKRGTRNSYPAGRA